MNRSKVYRARRRKRPRKLSHLAAKVLSTVCAVAIFAGLLLAFSNAFGEPKVCPERAGMRLP